MKLKSTLYWVSTILIAGAFVTTGVLNSIGNEHISTDMIQLGYPLYFMKILGFWKIMAAIAILLPKTIRLKEWAYAGMLFDLSGASFSRISMGAPLEMIIIPTLILSLVITSWATRPKSKSEFSILPMI
ncbi:DoxX family protein [Crocinitomix catalasitica]|uniref:DoxX family protein n=1 Tax=Crocinitomix catalasitica TaxID=184607 RepID=UPI0004894E97|nr:DoxX family protein [Crocinitomix catalasitica]